MQAVKKWAFNASGFNQYGLYRDDVLYETDEVKVLLDFFKSLNYIPVLFHWLAYRSAQIRIFSPISGFEKKKQSDLVILYTYLYEKCNSSAWKLLKTFYHSFKAFHETKFNDFFYKFLSLSRNLASVIPCNFDRSFPYLYYCIPYNHKSGSGLIKFFENFKRDSDPNPDLLKIIQWSLNLFFLEWVVVVRCVSCV